MTVVLSSALRDVNLRDVLASCFPPMRVDRCPAFRTFSASNGSAFSCCFAGTTLFILCTSFFLPHQDGAVILVSRARNRKKLSTADRVAVGTSRRIVVRRLRRLFAKRGGDVSDSGGGRLSAHRASILRLVIGNDAGGRVTSGLGVDLGAILDRHGGVAAGLNVGAMSKLAFCTVVGNVVSNSSVRLWGRCV